MWTLADVVKAQLEHIGPIAEKMREADAVEVWLSSAKTPYQAMAEGFSLSVRAWTIMDDGAPIGMFGVSSMSILGNVGIPWLLGTDEMLKIRRQFIRESMRYLDEVLSLYPYLTNFVHAENVASLRWLSWMGFTFYGPYPVGYDGSEFFRFERRLNV